MSHAPTAPVGTGLIGYGLAGSVFHAPLILAEPRLRLHAVASSRGEQIGRELPGVRAVADSAALIADPAVELVVIASPNASHAPLAEQALRAGKHVVVDKPFAIASADAQRLIDLAAARGRVLSAFQNRRWDHDFLTLRRTIAEGRLGEVYQYEARYDRFRPQPKQGWRERPEPGAGVLYDLGAHLIDQALELFGLPESVSADVQVQRATAQADDWFHLRLRYGRRRVILGASCLIAGPGPHFSVHGDQGSFVKYGLDGQEAALKAGLRPGMPGWGEEPEELRARYTDAEGRSETLPHERGAYEAYYRGIAAAIRDGAPPPVRAEQARDVIVVIEAALRSAAEGREVALAPR
jgi:scyllo-inositol 2-dehydrogenase (NADP+)